MYAKRFSTQLIIPLSQLTAYAKEVADGKLKTDINRQAHSQNDEIGSLTSSIYTMIDTLTAMITQEKKTGEEMRKASESLHEKNSELEKMNSIMLGRELKMIELKKEIEELKSKMH
jgi:methyl-accepting chemotaxis protein